MRTPQLSLAARCRVDRTAQPVGTPGTEVDGYAAAALMFPSLSPVPYQFGLGDVPAHYSHHVRNTGGNHFLSVSDVIELDPALPGSPWGQRPGSLRPPARGCDAWER